MAPPVPITFVGQRAEADYFETEFNEEVTETTSKDGKTTTKTHVKKLASHGNALACFVSIDVFSGKVPSMKHSLEHIQYVVKSYFSSSSSICSRSGSAIEGNVQDCYSRS